MLHYDCSISVLKKCMSSYILSQTNHIEKLYDEINITILITSTIRQHLKFNTFIYCKYRKFDKVYTNEEKLKLKILSKS